MEYTNNTKLLEGRCAIGRIGAGDKVDGAARLEGRCANGRIGGRRGTGKEISGLAHYVPLLDLKTEDKRILLARFGLDRAEQIFGRSSSLDLEDFLLTRPRQVRLAQPPQRQQIQGATADDEDVIEAEWRLVD